MPAPDIIEEIPDELVPDPQCRKECGRVSAMTWWRWENGEKPLPEFPDRYRIGNRNYRARRQLEALKSSRKVKTRQGA